METGPGVTSHGQGLDPDAYRINFRAFLWHSVFLALAVNFVEINTVVPAMVLRAGGGALFLGVISAVLLGGASLFQLLFAGYLSHRATKKGPLLVGIHLRIASLALLGALLWWSDRAGSTILLGGILLLVSVFSLSGAFAGVAYVDLLGKGVAWRRRKHFFSLKQVINAVGTLASAFAVRFLLTAVSFPENFALAFLAAAILLWFASGGFWLIREPESVSLQPSDRLASEGKGQPVAFVRDGLHHQSLRRFLAESMLQVRRDRRLARYLIVVNTVGLGAAVMPFVVLLARNRFGLHADMVGDFLLLRTLGMMAAGLGLVWLSQRVSYRHILVLGGLLGALVPLGALLFQDRRTAFTVLFFGAGLFAASYKMAVNGILLEISNDANRAAYAGISGAGSFLVMVFPILAGKAISLVGFEWVFSFVVFLMVIGLWVSLGLRCPALTDATWRSG